MVILKCYFSWLLAVLRCWTDKRQLNTRKLVEERNWWCKILMCELLGGGGFYYNSRNCGITVVFLLLAHISTFKYPTSKLCTSVESHLSHCHAVMMHGNYFFRSRSRLFPASLKYSLTVSDPVTLYPLPWIHNLARELRGLWTSAVYCRVGLSQA